MDTVDESIKGRALAAEALYRRVEVEKFPFTSTAEIDGQTDFIGHDRALEAMRFGIGIRKQGFNLYLLGPAGTGKYKIARSFLEKRAAGKGRPTSGATSTTSSVRRRRMPCGFRRDGPCRCGMT